MYERHKVGKVGETISVKYLEKNAYQIIQRNFECRYGEIDIIAKEKDELVFIEVKTRTNKIYGQPIEAVDKTKQKHIKKATQYYLYKNKLEDEFIRLDVIEVYLFKGKYKLEHIKQII